MTTRLMVLLLALPAVAAAHPLGNLSVNRYAALHVTAGRLVVRYVVDMAEIPAFQEIATIDRDGSGALEAPERTAYLGREQESLARGLGLAVAGARVALTPEAATLELPPGAGGLSTLRLDLTFAAPLGAARGAVEFHDDNFTNRFGWGEIVADCDDGCSLLHSTVPRADRSAALRAYPTDQLAEPPVMRQARFEIAPRGAPADTPAGAVDAPRGPAGVRDRLTELLATDAPLGPGLVVTALFVAVLLGALHALGPGHGKAVVGAYLVGARGTARDAIVLGLVVTATHTAGVYALGLVTLAASHWVMPERLFPWLGVCSGLLVLGIGASLATSRLTTALGEDGHHHDHDHGHHHHHPDGQHHRNHHPSAPSLRSLVALGVSGGLLPCPSALVVMLGAIALGRVLFGLGLIVAFSAGLAVVITSIGLLFVHARRWLERLPVDGALARWAPVVSAVVIASAGLLMVARGLAEAGVVGAAS